MTYMLYKHIWHENKISTGGHHLLRGRGPMIMEELEQGKIKVEGMKKGPYMSKV